MKLNSLTSAAPLQQEQERKRHNDTVYKLAEELGAPIDEVRGSYEEVLALFENATVKDYVPIFICRHVKERFYHLSDEDLNIVHG